MHMKFTIHLYSSRNLSFVQDLMGELLQIQDERREAQEELKEEHEALESLHASSSHTSSHASHHTSDSSEHQHKVEDSSGQSIHCANLYWSDLKDEYKDLFEYELNETAPISLHAALERVVQHCNSNASQLQAKQYKDIIQHYQLHFAVTAGDVIELVSGAATMSSSSSPDSNASPSALPNSSAFFMFTEPGFVQLKVYQ